MSGAYCRTPKAADEVGKGPEDYPVIFNPWSSSYFDWSKAFPSALNTFGTVFLYLSGVAFVVAAFMADPEPDQVLGYMLIFTGIQWVPYIVVLLIMNGPNPIKGLLLNLVYCPHLPPVGIEACAWSLRSAAAQKENTTALTIFAPAVLLFIFRHAADTSEVKGACMTFLIARVAHYVFLVGPIGSPQPIPVFPTVAFLVSIAASLFIVIKALM